MWRAFFMAVGIVLIMAGVECLMVGEFTISQKARLPQSWKNRLEGYPPNNDRPAFSPYRASPSAPASQWVQGYGGVPSNRSRFGPSRFSDPFGNTSLSQNGRPRPTGYPAQPFYLSGYQTGGASSGPTTPYGGARRVRIIRTEDWMPWSLAALGAVIVLYTRSLGQRDFGSGE